MDNEKNTNIIILPETGKDSERLFKMEKYKEEIYKRFSVPEKYIKMEDNK